jgi:hypothetical protein
MSPDMELLDLADLFSSNKQSEENGRWVELNAATKFKVRAFGCAAANDLREKLQKPYVQLLRAGMKIPDEKNEEIALRILAEAILVDWAGVKVGDWQPDYSTEAAMELFEKLPKLANWIAGVSMDSQNFRDEAREDGAKNS